MKLTCSDCNLDLKGSQINVRANTATCPRCGVIYPISRLIQADDKRATPIVEQVRSRDDFDIGQPPSGVTYENQGYGWTISATMRRWGGWVTLIVMIGNGIAFGLIMASQVFEGKFDLESTLFAILFLLIGCVMSLPTLLLLFGQTIVTSDERDRDAGSVRVGVGPLAWTQSFRWSEITQVCETDSGARVNDHPVLQITLMRDQGDINFGALLKDERRRYVIDALRMLVVEQPN